VRSLCESIACVLGLYEGSCCVGMKSRNCIGVMPVIGLVILCLCHSHVVAHGYLVGGDSGLGCQG
jgi:hypothetical protein